MCDCYTAPLEYLNFTLNYAVGQTWSHRQADQSLIYNIRPPVSVFFIVKWSKTIPYKVIFI